MGDGGNTVRQCNNNNKGMKVNTNAKWEGSTQEYLGREKITNAHIHTYKYTK